jgi:hypothetical protein
LTCVIKRIDRISHLTARFHVCSFFQSAFGAQSQILRPSTSTMSTSGSDDDDSINVLLAGGISSTPNPGGPVVETTATCDAFLGEKPPARLRWKQIRIVTCANKKGKVTRVVPFLEDLSNWMDIRLAHQMLADKPFEAPHGKAGEEWMNSAHYLSKAVDPDGRSVFPNGIKPRQLKDRFNDIMAFMKKLESEVPMRSGCDDEDDPTTCNRHLKNFSS